MSRDSGNSNRPAFKLSEIKRVGFANGVNKRKTVVYRYSMPLVFLFSVLPFKPRLFLILRWIVVNEHIQP